jgi:cytochrome c biogenesis protein CcmG/thiol:disulfide interchange protein DsbE
MAVRMSRKIWIVLAIVVVAVGATVGVSLSHSPASPDGPSNSTLSIITWNETTLSTLEGSPAVLNFWSIACSWCRYQLPFLEAVAQQSDGELEVVAINMANSAADIRRFFGDYEPAMTIAVDGNREAFLDYCLAYNNTGQAIPFTLFIDSEGVVQHVKIGAFASEEQLWDTLNDIFGITAPQTS